MSKWSLGLFAVCCSAWGCLPPVTQLPSEVDGGPDAIDAGTVDAGAPDAGPGPMEVRDAGIISKQFGSTFQAEPSIASGPAGRRVVAWLEYTSSVGRYQVAYAISDDAGETFSAPKRTETPDGWWARSPNVVTGPQGIWIVWPAISLVNGARDDVRMLASLIPPGASAADAPFTLDDETRQVRVGPSATSLSSGALLAAYLERNGAIIARRTATGGLTQTVLPGAGLPTLCSNGTRAYATDLRPSGISLTSSDDDGASWPVAQTVLVSPAGRVPFTDPRCAASGTQVWVLFGEGAASSPSAQPLLQHVWLARSDDGGRTFAPPVDTKPESPALAMLPNVTALDDAAFVSFYVGSQDGDPAGAAMLRRARREGLGAPTVVRRPLFFGSARTPPTWLGDSLGISSQGARVDVAYADNAESASHVGVWSVNGAALDP